MTLLVPPIRCIALLVLSLALLACPTKDRTSENGSAVAAEAPPPRAPLTTDCDLQDRSGPSERQLDLSALRDPVADKILRAAPGPNGDCPRSFREVQAKLRATDDRGCDGGMFSEVQTILVSERAQLRRTAEGTTEGCGPDPIGLFRGVTLRACGSRPVYGLLATVFGLSIHDEALPTDTELVGFDQTRGVFNYYSLEQGQWVYHGDSLAMLEGATEEGDRRCAACHVSGGLVLKELRSPWVFWEGRDTLPGVTEILDRHRDLGSRARGKVLDLRPAGKELEDAIEAGNRAWTKTRVSHLLKHGSLRDVLAPLFCSTEIELGAAAQSVTPPASREPEDGSLMIEADALLVDARLGVDHRFSVPLSAYHRALQRANQRMQRACGATLHDAQGHPVRDTAFDLVYPHRSSSDDLMLEELLRRGVLDEALITAVSGVDVSRPVFSPTRCGLLELVPEEPVDGRDAASVRARLRSAVDQAEQTRPGASELAEFLRDPERARQVARAFVETCAARPEHAFMQDLLREVSRRRRAARALPIIEMTETLPVDDLELPTDGRLDPTTCRFGPA